MTDGPSALDAALAACSEDALAAARRRLAAVRERISRAAADAGRRPEDVSLLAVTKSRPPEALLLLHAAGQRAFGENRVQELLAKQDAMSAWELEADWQLIGTLQRNKVRHLVHRVGLIHSVHSLRLLQALENMGDRNGMHPEVLLQVNWSREESKSGFAPGELDEALRHARDLEWVRVRGLMTMAAPGLDRAAQERFFGRVRDEFDRVRGDVSLTGGMDFDTLSMGMTDDFEAAVRCGSTLVRIGRALFENADARPAVRPNSCAADCEHEPETRK
ncbi:MAG: YggS family pyridoxal phosphate-dependent enzyme [Bacillota bacterium]|nr:YggS family pyridoxal phosphate-dependent enzyme [Bacillota bacterium]